VRCTGLRAGFAPGVAGLEFGEGRFDEVFDRAMTTEPRARLRARKVETRLDAVRELAHDPGDGATELLLEAVRDKSGIVAARAIRALGERLKARSDHVDDPGHGAVMKRAARALMERYWSAAEDGKKADPGCLVRIEAVRLLGEWRVHEAADIFFDAVETFQIERSGNGLEDVAIPLRVQAAAALALVRPPGALLALSILLFDDDPRLETVPQDRPFRTIEARLAAAKALGVLGDPGGAAVLGLRLAHGAGEVPEVLVACMDALASLDESAALKVIPPYLRDPNPYLAAAAATALAGLSQPYHAAVLERLSAALADRIDGARSSIALAIASMRCDEAVGVLRALALDGEAAVALEAVSALAQRGDSPARSALEAVVRECEDRLIRMKAQELLAAIS